MTANITAAPTQPSVTANVCRAGYCWAGVVEWEGGDWNITRLELTESTAARPWRLLWGYSFFFFLL